MATYTKTSWGAGSEPTDTDLNKIETGIFDAHKSSCAISPASAVSNSASDVIVKFDYLLRTSGASIFSKAANGGITISKAGNYLVTLHACATGGKYAALAIYRQLAAGGTDVQIATMTSGYISTGSALDFSLSTAALVGVVVGDTIVVKTLTSQTFTTGLASVLVVQEV